MVNKLLILLFVILTISCQKATNSVWYCCFTFDSCVRHPDSCELNMVSGACYPWAVEYEYDGEKYSSIRRQDVEGATRINLFKDSGCQQKANGFVMNDFSCKTGAFVVNGVKYSCLSYFEYIFHFS